MIRVLIADDHRLLLDGLAQALDSLPDIDVVGKARNGRELLDQINELKPGVLVVDIEMPDVDGLSALTQLRGRIPAVVVSMHADDQHRQAAAAASAAGFLSKSAPLPDLAAAVRAAAGGETFIDPGRVRDVLARHREAKLDPGAAALTEREREVMTLLAAGVSNTEELADQLYISQKTVKNHLASIYEKLAVSDRTQAAVEAIRLGLITRSSTP